LLVKTVQGLDREALELLGRVGGGIAGRSESKDGCQEGNKDVFHVW